MKNILQIMMVVATFFLLGCKKDKLTNQDLVQLEDIILNVPSASQTIKTDVAVGGKSNNYHLYSPSSALWLTQEPVINQQAVYVHIDANNSGATRTSYIMVRNGKNTQKIIVNQDIVASIDLSRTYKAIRYLGGTEEVTITNFSDLTNVAFTIDAQAQSWLSAQLTGNKVVFTAAENSLTTTRTGTITVTGRKALSGTEVTNTIEVFQGKGGMTPYVTTLPDFSQSNVYKVMDGTKQVAQITKEYLRLVGKVNAQAIVVYPVENDIVQINNGYVASILKTYALNDNGGDYTFAVPTGAIHGGSVSFSKENNSISTYVDGTSTTPVTTVYMPGDIGLGPDVIPNAKATTLVPHTIVDVRGTETQTYPIVKIGAQYWMGKNLNTLKYNSRAAFANIPTNETTDISKANVSSYLQPNAASTAPSDLQNRDKYGLYYSYTALGAVPTIAGINNATDGVIDDKISPDGWIVPTKAEALSLKAYIGVMSRLRAFKNTDGSIYYATDGRFDDNITGFNAENTSYRNGNGATAWAGLGNTNGAWFFTRTLAAIGSTTILHMNDVLSGGSSIVSRNYTIRSLNTTAITTSN